MTHNVLVSVIGPDRVGLVSALTGRLYDVGASLGDASFAVLGEGCEFTGIAELPDGLTCNQLLGDLRSLPTLAEAQVSVSEYRLPATHRQTAFISHHFRVSGGDRPGLVARLTEVFVEFNANIVRMNSERVPGTDGNRYTTDYYVFIPPDFAKRCLAAVTNTAHQLQVECIWQEM